MTSSWGSKALRVLLCLSLLTGSTTISVEHSHEHGHLPHTHGFGLVRACSSSPGEGSLTDGSSKFTCRHRHVLLVGIEIYDGETLPDSSSPSPAAPSLAEPQVILGAGVDVSNVSLATNSSLLGKLSLLGACFVLPQAAPLAIHSTHWAFRPAVAARCGLCDCARGERSGVSLT